MKTTSLLHTFSVLPLAALITTTAFANPAPTEPERIYNLETGQFDTNPDYHEPAARQAARKAQPFTEPRRIYDLESRQFIVNPDYREPAHPAAVVRTGEPRRIYNIETGQYDANPDYREPVNVRSLVGNAAPTPPHRQEPVTPQTSLAHRMVAKFQHLFS